eukprot:CAMPEP_0170412780 /NCGR_PEP_ID=MMETSP0117_2-20130122/31163_1 /TAXON_ID=400756 /ORGANISM="Durinskia baltica, Strain CSIRO CS-38" /LENGTH=159 /DNA_ID=CAMNT_0010670517 /DNA_START=175 /DNA_END=656 /DNA_ORIENTATION=-
MINVGSSSVVTNHTITPSQPSHTDDKESEVGDPFAHRGATPPSRSCRSELSVTNQKEAERKDGRDSPTVAHRICQATDNEYQAETEQQQEEPVRRAEQVEPVAAHREQRRDGDGRHLVEPKLHALDPPKARPHEVSVVEFAIHPYALSGNTGKADHRGQ